MSLNSSPQLVPVNLTRHNESPALTGHYMVDIITTHDGQDPSEHFVVSGRQTIPLTGYSDLEPGDILGTASAPLLRVPLEALAQHDEPHDVTAFAESPVSNVAQIPPNNLSRNFSIGSTMTNADHFFASGVRYPTTYGK